MKGGRGRIQSLAPGNGLIMDVSIEDNFVLQMLEPELGSYPDLG